MKGKLIIIKFILLLPIFGMADIPLFDVAKVKVDGRIFYIKFESPGQLKNGDFCYYDYQNEYQGEVKDIVYRILKIPDYYDFYKELHKIDIKNIPKSDFDEIGILYVLKSPIKIPAITNVDNVEILSVENGNTYGYAYSSDLVEKDNEWLAKFKIEKIVEFEIDGGYCHMGLFAIEGMVDVRRKVQLKKLMDDVSKNHERLEEELHRLYKQKIIMLGFCSC